MQEHPIQGLMDTAMKSIKEMVDVNTIVGSAVNTEDGRVIIPISKVSFGFASGGGEYSEHKKDQEGFPFAGGSAAGVSINPVAFLVVGSGKIKLLSANVNSSLEKILDLIPEILEKADKKVDKKNIVFKKTFDDKDGE